MARHLFRTLSLCLALTVVLSQAAWPMRMQNSQTPAEQPRREIKLDPKVFDAYVGQYKRDEFVKVVFRDGDKFFVGNIDGPVLEIFAESETEFFFKDVPVRITFIKDGQGKVTHYLRKQGGQELRTDKISDQVPAEVISSNKRRPFDKQEAMIPVRDGVKLHTVIFIPKDAREPLPILIQRTPYGSDVSVQALNFYQKELVEDGYIFVFQDIRGRYKSEGQFIMNRPPRDRRDPKAVDESTDTYDTIEWLVKNAPNNNGRVGVFGVSYDAWLAGMALLDPHPALKAVSPQGTAADMWMGDDFFHHGAFRLSYGHEYVASMENGKEDANVKVDKYDTYDWYLKLGPLSNITDKLPQGKYPTWQSFVTHPAFDQFWQSRSMHRYLTDISAPTMNVAGWWDQEDFYGPMKAYEVQEKNDAKGLNFLVVGPWNHGGWTNGNGEKLGKIEFKSVTAKYFREQIQAPFFAHYLKGKGDFKLPEARAFQTGSNQWMSYDQWPPRNLTKDRPLYFHDHGKLSFDQPTQDGEKEFDSYVSDPAHPVPYRQRPVELTYDPRGSGWYTWLVEDQRFAQSRSDVLTWETDPLTEDVTVTGDIVANLFASTSGSDSDWVVKLIDVYPEEYPDNPKMGGYQLMIAGEAMRGRYHRSFEKPEPLVPNKVTEFVFSIRPHDHRFLKGHKIMVQVQSTWFPVIDRNPQKYAENIFKAREADYQAATQHIYRSKRFPSHLKLPIVTTTSSASESK